MTRRSKNLKKLDPHQAGDGYLRQGEYQKANGRGLLLVVIAIIAILIWAVLA
jgi:hypothetical protein